MNIDIHLTADELELIAKALSAYMADNKAVKYSKTAKQLSEGINHALRELHQ